MPLHHRPGPAQYSCNTDRNTSVSTDDPNAVDPTRSQNKIDTVLRRAAPEAEPSNGDVQNGQNGNSPEGSPSRTPDKPARPETTRPAPPCDRTWIDETQAPWQASTVALVDPRSTSV